MHQMGYQGREAVVVPETDLMGGDRVVLVDHRDDAKVKQPVQCAPRIGVVRAPGDVVGSEQDLTDSDVVDPERVAVRRDQRALTDAGGSLLGSKVTRPADQPQRREAGGNGT